MNSEPPKVDWENVYGPIFDCKSKTYGPKYKVAIDVIAKCGEYGVWLETSRAELLAEVEALTESRDLYKAECQTLAAGIHETRAERDRLRGALEVIRDCPPAAVHLMPMAADAALLKGGDRE